MIGRLGAGAAWRRGAVGLLAMPVFLAACSSSGSGSGSSAGSSEASAKAEVCAARTDVQTSFQKVVDDLKALNFGQAKSDAAAVKTAVDGLASARTKLNDATKAEIEPSIAALKTSLASVQSASSLTEATAALDSAKASFQSSLDAIGKAAGCS